MVATTSDGSYPDGPKKSAIDMPQALVILDANRAEEVLSGAAGLVKVTQRLPPRLAIVEGDADGVAALRNIHGVVGVFDGPVPETVLGELNPTERLFADAWVSSRRSKPDRRGEGLPWDAEGFEPPNGKDIPYPAPFV